jgi:hypothetical protein
MVYILWNLVNLFFRFVTTRALDSFVERYIKIIYNDVLDSLFWNFYFQCMIRQTTRNFCIRHKLILTRSMYVTSAIEDLPAQITWSYIWEYILEKNPTFVTRVAKVFPQIMLYGNILLYIWRIIWFESFCERPWFVNDSILVNELIFFNIPRLLIYVFMFMNVFHVY